VYESVPVCVFTGLRGHFFLTASVFISSSLPVYLCVWGDVYVCVHMFVCVCEQEGCVAVSKVPSQFAHSHSGSSFRGSGVPQITHISTHTPTHMHTIDLALQTVTVMDGHSLASIFTPELLCVRLLPLTSVETEKIPGS